MQHGKFSKELNLQDDARLASAKNSRVALWCAFFQAGPPLGFVGGGGAGFEWRGKL
jgi:hypothetical protein